MTIAWILGRGGLLGTALHRTLVHDGTQLFAPGEKLCWSDEQRLGVQLAREVRAFSAQARGARRWEIYWAAGIGVMASPPEALAPETRALALLLRHIESDPVLASMGGSLALSSSAGAIYAGSVDNIITEHSAPSPTTAYAAEKLRQEALLRAFTERNGHVSALIARLSTLYGTGQAPNKPQGLLTHIARSMLRNKPIQIFVPYDTIRDYLAADDAATAIISTLRIGGGQSRVLTKIFASETPTTIAEILAIFKRLARTPPRVIRCNNRLTPAYAHRIQFRSIATPNMAGPAKRGLPVGIAQLLMAERLAFGRGSRPD